MDSNEPGQMRDGKLLVFKGMNWKLAGDSKWVEHCVPYIANGNEERLGERSIGGEAHVVFRMCDDDFGAQPKSVVDV